jgi:ribonuclease P protein component
MASRFGLDKKQKLKSRKLIAEVFANGKNFSVYPLRVTYLLKKNIQPPGIQIGVTASKKNFKRAVDRNRIKRLLREAYRLQKNELLEKVKEADLHCSVFFLFTGRELVSYKEVSDCMAKVLEQLHKRLFNENPQ